MDQIQRTSHQDSHISGHNRSKSFRGRYFLTLSSQDSVLHNKQLMVRSCIPAVWCLGKLDIFSLDVKRIILMKVRETFEQEKQSLSFNGRSLYAIKRRAKRLGCCYPCGRFTCNSVIRENDKPCRDLQLLTSEQERRVLLCKEPLSKTKEIWSETDYIKWDQRNALEKIGRAHV